MPEYYTLKHKLKVEISEETMKNLLVVHGIDIPAMIHDWLESVDDEHDAELAEKEGK